MQSRRAALRQSDPLILLIKLLLRYILKAPFLWRAKGAKERKRKRKREKERVDCIVYATRVCNVHGYYTDAVIPWLIHDAEARREEEEKEDGNSHRGGNEEPDKYVRATRRRNLDLRRVEKELV